MSNHAPGVEIAVRDTGIGLDMEHQDLVFEKFYQVGSVELHSSGKTSFKGGGPGVGLAIVRGVARAHGGRTWVESAGHDEVSFTGSTFYLQLPSTHRRTRNSFYKLIIKDLTAPVRSLINPCTKIDIHWHKHRSGELTNAPQYETQA